ncbi:MAG TPA: YhjD/YihY/BrkB family envelope integrity protein [Acidimicrobiales bacterium]|nr:YhjD/YihY/BrkB family envelope integrity protein [Acidimicrobiales bacterium]
MTERVALAKAKGDEMVVRLEAARPKHRSVDVAFVTIERDRSTAGSVLAAAVAFRLFLFMVPYVFVLVYGFGLAASAADKDPQTLAEQAGVAGLIASTITVAADESLLTRIAVFLAASYALISTSRSFLKVLAAVHALAWLLPPRRPKKLIKPALIFIVIVTAALVLVQAISWLRNQSLIAGFTAEFLLVAVPTLMWLVISDRFFVHAPGSGWRDLLPGAFLVGVGIQILHFVTVYWITRVLASKSETYGAIGAALAILFWCYLLGRVLAASAVLNASAWQQRHARPLPPPPPPA